jgi:hypothetical protein
MPAVAHVTRGDHAPDPDRGEVHGDRGVPGLAGDLGQWGADGRAAGVVHPDVERAELGDGAFGEPLDGRVVGHVGRHGDRAAPEVAQLLRDAFDLFGPARGQEDGCAGLGEQVRDALADVAAGPGHDGNVCGEVQEALDRHRIRGIAQSWPERSRCPRGPGAVDYGPCPDRSTPSIATC